MNRLVDDLRYAARLLVKAPRFTLTVVLTLALGIGANTAIFSVVDAVLLRPLPYRSADRLVQVAAIQNGQPARLSMPEFDDLRQAGSFEEVAGYSTAQYNISGPGTPEEIRATIATHQLFSILGVKPLLGAVWTDANDRHEDYAVMLAHAFWVRKFGADPNIVGKQIVMDGAPYFVTGVLPPGFQFPIESQVFRCWGTAPRYYQRRYRNAEAVARIREGGSITQARHDIEAIGRRLAREYPQTNGGLGFTLRSLRDSFVGDARPYLFLLAGMVGFVLVIACANAINLLLSRSMVRGREVAIRAALGAGRGALIRQLLMETVLLALISGVAGLALAIWGVRLLSAMMPATLPLGIVIRVDAKVLLFLFAVSVITGVFAGLSPALKLSRPDLNSVLKESVRGSSAGGQGRLRGLLIAVEVAVAIVILVGASLMIQTVMRLQRQDLGFDQRGLLTFRVALPWKTYDRSGTLAFHEQVLNQLRALPGVVDAALDNALPFSRKFPVAAPVLIEGEDAGKPAGTFVSQHRVSHEYHHVMGIALRSGRLFGNQDRDGSLPVVLVSQETARRLWPNADPIGRRLNLNPQGTAPVWHTVAGVVADVRATLAKDDRMLDVYLSSRQMPGSTVAYVVRTAGDPSALNRAVENAVRRVDGEQSVYDILPMERRIRESFWEQRLSGSLFVLFGALALVLSTIGAAGVISYNVSQRRRELGIRIALGARRSAISWLVLRQTVCLAAVGAGIGLIAAFLISRLMTTLLYQVNTTDPKVFVGVPLLLLAAAALSCYLPVYRASRIDPLIALRDE